MISLRNASRAALAVAMAFVLACAPAAAPTPAPTPGDTPAPTATDLTLTVAIGEVVDSLDAHQAGRSAAKSVVMHIAEGLIDRDPDTAQPVPRLAESWSRPDPLTWEFALRQGVVFHNGEPFDADVVEWNIERVIGTETSLGSAVEALVESVEVLDSHTVRITTSSPAAFFLERLINIWMMPPQETEERGEDYVAHNPVGTGPYMFVEWLDGEHIAVTRNPEYWGDAPAYKDVVFREITEPSTALAEFQTGGVDIIHAVPSEIVDAINDSGVGTVETVQGKQLVEVMLDQVGRTAETPWTNVLVRRAANHAVDREAMARTLFEGLAETVPGFVAPTIFGYDPTLEPYAYDPDRARELLAEAGFPEGFETVIKVYPIGGVDSVSLAETLAAYWAEVGIRASIEQIPSQQIGQVITGGEAGPTYVRRNAGGAGFDAAFGFAFYETGHRASYYSNPEVDRLRAEAEAETDPDERLRLYAQVGRILYEDAAVVFGWTLFNTAAVADHVDYKPMADNFLRLYHARPK